MKFQFTAEQPNTRWVTDTKAVETSERWLYLVVILHLCLRLAVGWAIAASEDEQLVELALRMAIAQQHPSTKLLHHSDRGSECTRDRYQVALRVLGMKVSIGDMESNGEL